MLPVARHPSRQEPVGSGQAMPVPRRLAIPDGPGQAMSLSYDRSAEAWRSGPEKGYRRFARALVDASPVSLGGLSVLDLGAGTGAVSAELRAVGATPVAVDLSLAMLSRARRFAEPRVAAADATHLPFANGRFDASLSGFLLNHLPEPFRLLAEAARVTRRGGMVMTMTFAAGDSHPVKAAVEGVAALWGWEAPDWYHEQRHWASLTDTPAGLRAQAQQAGLQDADVISVVVDAGLRTPPELVTWRLGMAHMAEFVSQLPTSERRRLVAEVELAVSPLTQPLRRVLLILSSRLPA